ncbi:MAG: universal stress protein [Acidobacteriota bacterium]
MRILIPIDNSTCSTAAIDAVISQFHPVETEVRVLHVIAWPRDLSPSLTFAAGAAAADAVLSAHDRIRGQSRELVDRAVRRLAAAGFSATPHVLDGDPRHAIVEMAAEWPADTIVIGSQGRHGWSRLLLGRVAEGIVRHASCSVEVVRDRGAAVASGHQPRAS